ncbi:hypothetical protein [Nitratireductor basaltis]|uniref:Methyltransferase type 11 n=1 Tax=Nitratireductor basaltis TaxID=472175 RepID=A0A084UBK3_9HYPH|nr:hypothetical protein [Nitratireductor basaltis]KFB10339.1 Methyltransferase type 11 precursor [Nitratireductor basaltis]
MTKPDWWPSWEGDTVVIIASGPSAKDVPLDKARGKARFIAINTSWKLCPDADILFACDDAWWRKHHHELDGFAGLKLTVDQNAAKRFEDVNLVDCRKPDDRLVLEPINTVGWGGNSGFHALNLAVQFGCRKIILVGYDMNLLGGLHWHGAHPEGLNNPKAGNVERWRRAVDNAWKVIEPLGIQVINCSPVSSLRNYPKMKLHEALAA